MGFLGEAERVEFGSGKGGRLPHFPEGPRSSPSPIPLLPWQPAR